MTPARHALGALMLERAAEIAADRMEVGGGVEGYAAAAHADRESAADQYLSEAEAVYRRDLQLHPNNLWALSGLCECRQRAEARGATADCCGERRGGAGGTSGGSELDELSARRAAAAARSDVEVRHSCFCAGMLNAAKPAMR